MLNTTWWQGGGFAGAYTPVTGVGKVVIVQAEGDLVISDGRVFRDAAAETGEYRVYEVSGAAHIPDIPANHDNPQWGPQIPGTNPVDWSIVARAGFVAGDRWVRWNRTPPASVFLEDDTSGDPDPVFGFPTGIARDADLNALGGVRLPEVELGVGRYMAADPNVPVAWLTGSWEDISCEPAAGGGARFEDHRDYVRGVASVLRQLRRDGFVLPLEGLRLLGEAYRSDVGNPDACL